MGKGLLDSVGLLEVRDKFTISLEFFLNLKYR